MLSPDGRTLNRLQFGAPGAESRSAGFLPAAEIADDRKEEAVIVAENAGNHKIFSTDPQVFAELPYDAHRMSRGPSNSEPLKDSERIRLDEVMRLTGVPRSTLYNWMEKGLFPNQAKKPDGTIGAYWFKDEINAWLEAGRNGSAPRRAPKPFTMTGAALSSQRKRDERRPHLLWN